MATPEGCYSIVTRLNRRFLAQSMKYLCHGGSHRPIPSIATYSSRSCWCSAVHVCELSRWNHNKNPLGQFVRQSRIARQSLLAALRTAENLLSDQIHDVHCAAIRILDYPSFQAATAFEKPKSKGSTLSTGPRTPEKPEIGQQERHEGCGRRMVAYMTQVLGAPYGPMTSAALPRCCWLR